MKFERSDGNGWNIREISMAPFNSALARSLSKGVLVPDDRQLRGLLRKKTSERGAKRTRDRKGNGKRKTEAQKGEAIMQDLVAVISSEVGTRNTNTWNVTELEAAKKARTKCKR